MMIKKRKMEKLFRVLEEKKTTAGDPNFLGKRVI